MPILEFFCKRCDQVTERILPAGTEREPCSRCGHIAKRVFPSRGSFQLMGGGWGTEPGKVTGAEIADFRHRHGVKP